MSRISRMLIGAAIVAVIVFLNATRAFSEASVQQIDAVVKACVDASKETCIGTLQYQEGSYYLYWEDSERAPPGVANDGGEGTQIGEPLADFLVRL
jgi:hypothetical protein